LGGVLAGHFQGREFLNSEILNMSTGTDLEFHAAARKAAFVERSAVGRIMVTGTDRIDLLHRLSTNDLLSVQRGQVVGTAFTTDKGRMVDYVKVCVLDSSLLLLTSTETGTRLVDWVEKFHIMEDIQLIPLTHGTAMFTVLGPESATVVSKLFDVATLPNTVSEHETSFGRLTVICIQEFMTTMVNLVVERDRAPAVWDRISSAGDSHSLVNMGVDAFEAYRISRGIPAASHEISESFNPYECGLANAISFTKGCYIGQEVIARLDTYRKIQRTMTGVVFGEELQGVRSPTPLNKGKEEVGGLTSVSPVAIGGKYVAIAIVKMGSVRVGDSVMLTDQGRSIEGIVSDFPIEL
jgi:hypothetical protein